MGFPYEEARHLFTNHEVSNVNEVDASGVKKYDFKSYFAKKPKADIEGLRKFLIEENQFSEERVQKQLDKLQKLLGQGMQMSFEQFFTLQQPAIQAKDKFDPFKRKDGKKRQNLTAGLANAAGSSAGAKKRKGALTADKLEQKELENNKENNVKN